MDGRVWNLGWNKNSESFLSLRTASVCYVAVHAWTGQLYRSHTDWLECWRDCCSTCGMTRLALFYQAHTVLSLPAGLYLNNKGRKISQPLRPWRCAAAVRPGMQSTFLRWTAALAGYGQPAAALAGLRGIVGKPSPPLPRTRCPPAFHVGEPRRWRKDGRLLSIASQGARGDAGVKRRPGKHENQTTEIQKSPLQHTHLWCNVPWERRVKKVTEGFGACILSQAG